MKYILTIFIFLFICISLSAQNTKPQKSAQDSINELNAAAGKFVDSLISKTSIKDMRDFLFANLTVKVYSDAKFSELYDFFIQSKVNEWATKRKKQ